MSDLVQCLIESEIKVTPEVKSRSITNIDNNGVIYCDDVESLVRSIGCGLRFEHLSIEEKKLLQNKFGQNWKQRIFGIKHRR